MSRIIRFLERMNNGINRFTLTLLSIAILALIGVAIWLWHGMKDDHWDFTNNDRIDVSPTLIDKMQSIGQWEFLTINDEELIDTVRNGFFSDDELVRIYYGTLRLGIDFKDCSKEWISNDDDTICVTLPEIKLLDYNFIDEARTKSFFESGKWSNKDRKKLYDKARSRMIERCLNEENVKTAQDNAKEQVRQILIPIAAPRPVKVDFENNNE